MPFWRPQREAGLSLSWHHSEQGIPPLRHRRRGVTLRLPHGLLLCAGSACRDCQHLENKIFCRESLSSPLPSLGVSTLHIGLVKLFAAPLHQSSPEDLQIFSSFSWGPCCLKVIYLYLIGGQRREEGTAETRWFILHKQVSDKINVKFKSHSDESLIRELIQLAKGKPFALHQLWSSLRLQLEKQYKWGISEWMLQSYFYLWNVPLEKNF